MKKLLIFIIAFLTINCLSAQSKIHEGDGTTYYNEVLYTVDGSKVRKGDGTTYYNTVLYTFDGNKIRQGDGTTYYNKVLYTINGSISYTKIACLLSLVL